MTIRPHNFGAGPAILPMPVMERAREEFLAARGTGLSAMEWSHRTPFYEELHAGIEASFRRLLDLEGDEGYRILFLQGGASLQFAQVPMNLATPSTGGDYVITGTWAKKAYQEAARIGRPRAIWDGEEQGFTTLPDPRTLEVSPEAAYLHLATNNTIFGTEFHELPEPPPACRWWGTCPPTSSPSRSTSAASD